MPSEESDRKLAAVMFTDIVGYTALTQSNERQALEVLERHNKLLRPFFLKYHGREVKTMGDAFLVEFDSALDATHCAIGIQKSLHDYNISTSDSWKIKLRIGIHLGDIVYKDKDIFGDAVNIASRIQPLAEPEGICISAQVFDQVHNKIDLPLQSISNANLKNVTFATNVYSVGMPWDAGMLQKFAKPEERTAARVAVLPFANMSPDPQDAYFADGITEEIITTLSGISALRIVSRTSVMGYKGTTKKLKEIGKDLEVGTILEGSLRKFGNRIRITAQLIDVANDSHLWAQNYDRNLDDVFAIQSEIASSISNQLKIRLVESEKKQLDKIPTTNIHAYENYLKGLHLAINGDLERWQDSIKYLEDAIKEDPDFSLAYSALGNDYVRYGGDFIPWKEAAGKAEPLISRALELDDNSSDAHVAKGNLAMQLYLDWDAAETEFKRAIELNPSNSEAHSWYAILFLFKGSIEEAASEARIANRLNPMGFTVGYLFTVCLLFKHEFDEALEVARRMVQFEPEGVPPKLLLAWMYWHAKKTKEAEELLAKVMRDPFKIIPLAKVLLERILLKLGRLEDARVLLSEIERESVSAHFDFVGLAPVYWALGNKDRAFEILDKAVDDAPIELLFDFRCPDFPPIREDPRYKALVSKLPKLKLLNTVRSQE